MSYLNKEHIYDLLTRIRQSNATSDEIHELLELMERHPEPDIVQVIEQYFKDLDIEAPEGRPEDPGWQAVLRRVLAADATENKNVKLVHRLSSWYWWAAASIIVFLGTGLYYYTFNQKKNAPIAIETVKNIAAPVSNRAMITLADGNQLFLDSLNNGQLVQQGNVKLIKLANGQIAYLNANGAISPAPAGAVNTLTNPRGSKVIDMQLSDGSHIWLNAGSAITYPVAFTCNERKVELKGEGYFEVAKDKTRKFIVVSNGVTTEVLGTHFNVNAYINEPAIKVTLLEGSVRTGNNNNAVVIKPGQQAVAGNGNVKVNNSPNLDQVMAWRNGYFNFDGLTLKQAMTQLERWYDIDVVYEGSVADEGLMGKMTRGISLNELMDVLQKIGVHYQLEGRKLIIKK